MRHGFKLKKLNRTSSHRKAMFNNMTSSLVMHEQIVTTLPKAKALRPIVEKLVTLSKEVNLNVKKKLYSITHSKLVVDKLCDLGKRYSKRPGGYLRIIRAGFRHGDMAPIAVIEFVERDETAKGRDYFNTNAEAQAVVAVQDDKKSAKKSAEEKAFEKINKEDHHTKGVKSKASSKMSAGKGATKNFTARKTSSDGK